jgi:hypothetical protein
MFGPNAPLNTEAATQTHLRGSRLLIAQEHAAITLDEDGTITVTQPAIARSPVRGMLPRIIEEDLNDSLGRALRFSALLLDHVDPLHRLSDVVAMAMITDGAYLAWRTRAEAAANPNSATIPSRSVEGPVAPNPARRRRTSLVHDAGRIAEDLTALLRRQHR